MSYKKNFAKVVTNISYRYEYSVPWYKRIFMHPDRSWISDPRQSRNKAINCIPPPFVFRGREYHVRGYSYIVKKIK